MAGVSLCLVAALVVAVAAQENVVYTTTASGDGKVRTFFIGAVEEVWDYAPTGIDKCTGEPFRADQLWATKEGGLIGTQYKKALYRGFTSADFQTQSIRNRQMAHLGVLGPIMHAEVGDELRIIFKNMLSIPVNMHADSYFIVDTAVQGTGLAPQPVQPGQTVIYRWKVLPEAGPAVNDTDSTLVTYRSAVDPIGDFYAGLIGPIIVTRKGAADINGRSKTVDFEFVNLFAVMNENNSPYLEDNLNTFAPGTTADPADIEESNLMHSINGYVFCNLNGLNTSVGARTRFYLVGMGTEVDLHTPHLHGNVLKEKSVNADVFNLIPSTVIVADMMPDNAGPWLYHCHVNDHIIAGMQAIYNVAGRSITPVKTGQVRTYYVAADEVPWNYVPTGINNCEGRPFTEEEQVFTNKPVYTKLQYREYTDSTFTKLKPRPTKELHMGLLGPVFRAEVGDVIKVFFKNQASVPCSVHPHGVFYQKDSEGAPYADGTAGNDKKDDSVAPGNRWVYTWQVPARAGPINGMSTMVWMYHSHTDETGDTNAGLVGYMVITADGMGKSAKDPSPKDVDDEVFTLFTILDENESIVKDLNALSPDPTDAEIESNLKHTVNGYLYCNGYPFTTGVGRKVRWYLGTLGTEADIHTISWERITGTFLGHRRDSVGLLPAGMAMVEMTPQYCNNGYLHCQVHDHILAGMKAWFKVGANPAGVCPNLPAVSPKRTIYLAADVVEWDFFPAGVNQCTGNLTDAERTFVEQTPTTIGSKYLKGLYREYTDSSYKYMVVPSAQLGYLGPTIELTVGESIRVVFKNNLDWAVNIAPHGVQANSVAVAQPGEIVTYIWTADVQSAPLPNDPSSISWLYHSNVQTPGDQLSGLYGAIIVRSQQWKKSDFDVQYVMSFTIVNENNSPFFSQNVARYLTAAVDPADEGFIESNLMHSINGYVFCNAPRFTAKNGQKVRWHLLSVGSELDLHAVTWRDYSVVLEGTRRFAVDLLPGLTKTVDMVAHSGKTLIQCDVTDHQAAGMQAIFDVKV